MNLVFCFCFVLFFSCFENLKNVRYEYWHLDYKSINLALFLVVKLGLKPMWLVSTCNLSPMMAACVTLKCMIIVDPLKSNIKQLGILVVKSYQKTTQNLSVFYCKTSCS